MEKTMYQEDVALYRELKHLARERRYEERLVERANYLALIDTVIVTARAERQAKKYAQMHGQVTVFCTHCGQEIRGRRVDLAKVRTCGCDTVLADKKFCRQCGKQFVRAPGSLSKSWATIACCPAC